MQIGASMHKFLIAIAAAVVLTPPAMAGMKVGSESREGADLSTYETYSWQAADPASSGLLVAEGTRLAGALEEIGDKALARKGRRRTVDDEGSLIIRYRGFAKEMVGTYGAAYAPPDVTWIVGSSAPPMVYKQGTLLVEALDAESGELLWAGWASDALEAFPNREKIARKAEKAMAKIMKKFPE
jgi:hypothetical protein